MSLIQHLNNSVTPQLPNTLSGAETDNMLEQFYALIVTRLCDEALLSQISTDPSNLFNKLWIDYNEQLLIERELSETHHIPVDDTKKIISVVTPLTYESIKHQANVQNISIFNFLLSNLDDSKVFLPTWSASVIPMSILSDMNTETINKTNDTLVDTPNFTDRIPEPSYHSTTINDPIGLAEQVLNNQQPINTKPKIPYLKFIIPSVFVLFLSTGLFMIFASSSNTAKTDNIHKSSDINQPPVKIDEKDEIAKSKTHKKPVKEKTTQPQAIPDISEFNENELAQPMSIKPTSGDTIVFEFDNEVSDSKLEELTSSTIISDQAKTSRAPTKVLPNVNPIRVEKPTASTTQTDREISELESEISPDIFENGESVEMYNEGEVPIYSDEFDEASIEIIEQ